jgi:hypothetical protein
MHKGRHRKQSVRHRRGSVIVAAGVMTASTGAALFAGAAPASAASTVVPDAQIASYAHRAGLDGCRGVGLATWVAISLAESGGNTYAHATGIEDSRGLWQINEWAWSSKLGNANLYDPATNAAAANMVCKASGPSAWSTYTNGAYASYLSRGYAAANAANSGAVAVKANAAVTPAPGPGAWYLSEATYHAAYLPAVAQLQQALANLGYSITVDGYFGPQTDSLVRAFQAAHGLTVDGVVGQATHRALFG